MKNKRDSDEKVSEILISSDDDSDGVFKKSLENSEDESVEDSISSSYSDGNLSDNESIDSMTVFKKTL